MPVRIAAAGRVLLLASLASGAQAARAERSARSELDVASDGEAEVLEHAVTAGENLHAIAARYGVGVDQLVALNPGLDPDHIRVGQKIAIDRDRSLVRITVQPGDRLQRIAAAYELKVADLLRWNPRVAPDRIRAGQELVLYPPRPSSPSESIGSPSSGQLVQARRLPAGEGYDIRAPERAFGTDETVRGLVAAFARARRDHPDAPRISVHDLSLPRGGPIDEHRSHQSGRDADVAYPQKRCPSGLCGFRRLGPADLDAPVAWSLLRYWLEHDLLEAVFIDYRLQPPLYREARAEGATQEQLARWFQYPRGRYEPKGVIRHFPKHADHMHVRFTCHASDPECRTLRPLMMHTASR